MRALVWSVTQKVNHGWHGKFKCGSCVPDLVQNSTRSRQVPQAFPSTVSFENIFNNM